MCILSVYALLKVVGYYDLSVLSMSVMGFQKSLDYCELYPIFVWIFAFLFNFPKPLSVAMKQCVPHLQWEAR